MKRTGDFVLTVVLSETHQYVINGKNEKYQIKKFSGLILGKNGICECFSEKNPPEFRIRITFNWSKLKGIIQLENGDESLITNLFIIWQDEEYECYKGLFMKQKSEAKFGIVFWNSIWEDEKEEFVYKGLFDLFCTLTELPLIFEEQKKKLLDQIPG